jgi:hypothetical protein
MGSVPARRSPPAPAALEYYSNRLPGKVSGPTPDKTPRPSDVGPVRPAHRQTARDLPTRGEGPPALPQVTGFVRATVPPVKWAEIWKKVGTGELSLPRGATSFNRPATPAVPQAPPGTRVPVGAFWKWRKLVINEPIAIHSL